MSWPREGRRATCHPAQSGDAGARSPPPGSGCQLPLRARSFRRQDALIDTVKKSKAAFRPASCRWRRGLGEGPGSAASRRVSSSSELDGRALRGRRPPLGRATAAGPARAPRLLDAMRMYRQGGALCPRAAPPLPTALTGTPPPRPGVWRSCSPSRLPVALDLAHLCHRLLWGLLASLQPGLFLLLFLSILLILGSLPQSSPSSSAPPAHQACPVPTALFFPSPVLGRSALPTADPVSYWSSCL